MKFIANAFRFLAGVTETGIPGNTDRMTDSYKFLLSGLQTPGHYTTEQVQQAAHQSGLTSAQKTLAVEFHRHRRETIKNLEELDRLTTDTAVLFSNTHGKISDRQAIAQETILINEAKSQIQNVRLNSLKTAYAEGLKIGR